MSNFSIERDKQKLIPYIKAALAVAPGLHLWARPLVAPNLQGLGRRRAGVLTDGKGVAGPGRHTCLLESKSSASRRMGRGQGMTVIASATLGSLRL